MAAKPSVAPKTVSDMFMVDPIIFVSTQQTHESPKLTAKVKKPKAELTAEKAEQIAKQLTNKGVYQGTPKKKKQK
jgi:hypothetical protein